MGGPFIIFNLATTPGIPGVDKLRITLTGFGVLWTDADTLIIRAALEEEKPFKWSGGSYLFGKQLWELTKADAHLTEDELRLLFLDVIAKDRRRFERLRHKFSGMAGERLASSGRAGRLRHQRHTIATPAHEPAHPPQAGGAGGGGEGEWENWGEVNELRTFL